MKILQGDSYPIPVEIKQDGFPVIPEIVEEVEITIGTGVRKTYTGGGYSTKMRCGTSCSVRRTPSPSAAVMTFCCD